MHTLYLTEAEQKIFSGLSPDIVKDVTAESETISFEDTEELRAIRFELFRPKDPEIIRFRNAAKAAKTDEELSALTETLDLQKIGDADLTQMLFTLGPTLMGVMIGDILSRASSAKDIELLAALSELRHAMLESLQQYSPQEP